MSTDMTEINKSVIEKSGFVWKIILREAEGTSRAGQKRELLAGSFCRPAQVLVLGVGKTSPGLRVLLKLNI